MELVELISKAIECLHNYLRLNDNAAYVPSGFVDSEDRSGNVIHGDWRKIAISDQGLLCPPRMTGNWHGFDAEVVRNDLKDYFNNTEGQLSWQLNHVRNCGRIDGQYYITL